MHSRRAFLKGGALSLFSLGWGGLPTFIANTADAFKPVLPYTRAKVLVCIFQRGAMDGLAAVTPFKDPHLAKLRPQLFMSPASEEASIDLDGKFALHPSLSVLHPLFKDNRLAIIHGTGSPNNTRSHFDAQDYMETGTPFRKGTESGWLNRAAGLMGHDATPFQAISITPSLPRSLSGKHPALAINDLQEFANSLTRRTDEETAKSFEGLYGKDASRVLSNTSKESFEAIRILREANPGRYKPSNGAQYPATPLGRSLRQIAQLIKMQVGLEVAFAEMGGWDTHVNQGTVIGSFARNGRDLSQSIQAFWTDLGALQDEALVMTMTEFGRTVAQNGSGGTDHGRASCMFLLGNQVTGGKVYGTVPELSPDQLEDGRDLPVTTDFRSVFTEVAQQHLHIPPSTTLFPGWSGGRKGLFRP